MTDVDIRDCGRTIAGDVVAFTIQWAGEPSGEVTWGARVVSPDQTEAVELGYVRDGGEERQYVESEGRRHDVEVDADLSGDEVTVRFEAAKVGVAVEWPLWCAQVSVDGEVVAEHVIPTG